jgi:hypothetical protein
MTLVKESRFVTRRATFRAHLKRTVEFGDICVDLDGMEVRRDGQALPITVASLESWSACSVTLAQLSVGSSC